MAWESLYPALLLLFHTEASGSGGISQVELVDGRSRCEGRLEVSYSGTRGTICPDRWNIQHAAVVCAQLGCGPALEAFTDTRFGAGKSSQCLSEIDCFGTEKELSACDQWTLSWIPTDHKWDAGVICSLSGISNVRLLVGPNDCMGRLEVNVGNDYGAVCDKDWGSQDAAVVCKELNCGAAMEMPRKNSIWSSPSRKKLLTSVFCTGSESSLSKCGARMESSKSDCDRYSEAEVSCAPDTGGLGLRLVHGVSSCDGRVEVQYNGSWGSISQFLWDMEEAQVVCRQLGCGEARRVMRDGHFGPGPGLVWLKATYCNGFEAQLSECGLLISNQTLLSDTENAVGVICEGPLSRWVLAFVVIRGTLYFTVYAVIHLAYFIVGKRSSRSQKLELRRRFLKSEEDVKEEEVV